MGCQNSTPKGVVNQTNSKKLPADPVVQKPQIDPHEHEFDLSTKYMSPGSGKGVSYNITPSEQVSTANSTPHNSQDAHDHHGHQHSLADSRALEHETDAHDGLNHLVSNLAMDHDLTESPGKLKDVTNDSPSNPQHPTSAVPVVTSAFLAQNSPHSNVEHPTSTVSAVTEAPTSLAQYSQSIDANDDDEHFCFHRAHESSVYAQNLPPILPQNPAASGPKMVDSEDTDNDSVVSYATTRSKTQGRRQSKFYDVVKKPTQASNAKPNQNAKPKDFDALPSEVHQSGLSSIASSNELRQQEEQQAQSMTAVSTAASTVSVSMTDVVSPATSTDSVAITAFSPAASTDSVESPGSEKRRPRSQSQRRKSNFYDVVKR